MTRKASFPRTDNPTPPRCGLLPSLAAFAGCLRLLPLPAPLPSPTALSLATLRPSPHSTPATFSALHRAPPPLPLTPAQAAALRNLPLCSIPSLVPAFIPGLSDILSLAPALHAVPSRHPFTWPWAAMGFARAQPAPASLPPAPRAAPGRSSPTPCRPPCPWPLWGKLFKIVLGLMCPGGLSGGGESQNEAKSRRFGMDLPSRAFYEGVNPKTIWNNCHR